MTPRGVALAALAGQIVSASPDASVRPADLASHDASARSAALASHDASAPSCGAFSAPSPLALRALAFGHDRALARLLWSRARVAHGACFARRQRFEGALAYVDAALALDPSFREPYRYVGAFVAAGPGRPSRVELEAARRVLAEGVRRFPGDAELRARAGAFFAFVAPAHLEPDEAAKWRDEGLRLLDALDLKSPTRAPPRASPGARRSIARRASLRAGLVRSRERGAWRRPVRG